MISDAALDRLLIALVKELREAPGAPSEEASDLGHRLVGALVDCRGPLRPAVERLEALFLEANTSQRRFIVDVVLEHVFEVENVRSAFLHWQARAPLSEAFEEAEAWAAPIRRERSRLLDLARRVAVELEARGARVSSVEASGIGTEAVVMSVARHPNRRLEKLVIHGDFEADKLSRASALAYALDERNWYPNEYVEGEYCVAVPDETPTPD